MKQTAASTPAVDENSLRPAANSPKAVNGANKQISVLPTSAPSHQSPARDIPSRLSISVPIGMLP